MFPKNNYQLYSIWCVTSVVKQCSFKYLFILKECKYRYGHVATATEFFIPCIRHFPYHIIVLCRNTVTMSPFAFLYVYFQQCERNICCLREKQVTKKSITAYGTEYCLFAVAVPGRWRQDGQEFKVILSLPGLCRSTQDI